MLFEKINKSRIYCLCHGPLAGAPSWLIASALLHGSTSRAQVYDARGKANAVDVHASATLPIRGIHQPLIRLRGQRSAQ